MVSAEEIGGNLLSISDPSMLNLLPVPLAAANWTSRQIEKLMQRLRKKIARSPKALGYSKTCLEKMLN